MDRSDPYRSYDPPPGDPWPPPPDETAPLAFGRPWMGGFLDDAMRTADVPAALKTHAVGWGDYTRARRDDPAFGLACVELDLVVRQSLLIRLEAQAAAGDTKALKLLTAGLETLRAQLTDAGIGAPVAPHWLDRVPLVRYGQAVLPQGPCSQCCDGLVISLTYPDGRQQTVIVRHRFFRDEGNGTEVAGLRDAQRLGAMFDQELYGEVPVVYGSPVGRDSDNPVKIARHSLDWGLHPDHTVPAPTGPYRAELEKIRADRNARADAARAKPAGGYVEPVETEAEWASYLPYEADDRLYTSLTVPNRNRYDRAMIGPDGNQAAGWRIRAEFRGLLAKYQPMAGA